MHGSEKAFVPALRFAWLTRFFDLIVGIFMPERRMRGRLAAIIDAQSGERVLEFGCGTGSNMAVLASALPACEITGIDIDPEVLAIAKAKLAVLPGNRQLDQYGGDRLPYEDQCFDAVFSMLVFHHLTGVQKQAALAEIHRVLKPGGRLILADWGRQPNILMRALFLSVQILDGFATTADNVGGLLPRMMRGAGFSEPDEKGALATVFGSITYWRAETTAIGSQN